MISSLKSEGRVGKQDFVYVGADDIYLCSARHSQFTFARWARPNARDQSQSAANRHRSERAHPKLPWHSQCPLAGIGRGTKCCAWLDAPRFAAKPQVQGRLASGEEFGPSCEYAPTAARFKPRRVQTHLTS